jgi:hypothetical protein
MDDVNEGGNFNFIGALTVSTTGQTSTFIIPPYSFVGLS